MSVENISKKKLAKNLLSLGLLIILISFVFLFNIKIGFTVFDGMISKPLSFLILGILIIVLVIIFVILIVYYIKKKKLIIISEELWKKEEKVI